MSYEEEVAFLAPFLEKAAHGGILVVGEIKRELDARLGRRTALASAYNLLHRHGWRKLAPDRQHPKASSEAQEEWKKIPRTHRPHRRGMARGRADQGNVSGRSTLWPHLRYPNMLVPEARPSSLSDRVEVSLRDMECDTERVRSIVSWPWIINSRMV
jgi:hypothetical protein